MMSKGKGGGRKRDEVANAEDYEHTPTEVVRVEVWRQPGEAAGGWTLPASKTLLFSAPSPAGRRRTACSRSPMNLRPPWSVGDGFSLAISESRPAGTPLNTKCTALSLISTVNGNTVRSFSTHGQQPAAQGSSTTVSRSDIQLIQYLDSSVHGLARRWRLTGYFPILYNPHRASATRANTAEESKY